MEKEHCLSAKRDMNIKETETVELKKSTSELKEGVISIAAILNKHGNGELYFGIRNDGTAVGQQAGEATLREISRAISDHIEPKIYPRVTTEAINGISCVRVSFQGHESPYFAYGRAYMRVADEDRQLSAKELENLFITKNRDKLRWDNNPSGMDIAGISEVKLGRFLEQAGLKPTEKHGDLDKLGLIQHGKLLNAAALFFPINPEIQLRCAVFAGTTSSTIIDRHDFNGDILELVEEAQKYILKNIHIGMRVEGLYREDVPEISPEALREAVINAFCHRDYHDPEDIRVAIFKDRVEIRNPGGLYGGLTLDQLKKGHVSKRRNPLICEMFRRIHMVEAWGRGIPLIMEKVPDVEFEETAGIFITSFHRPSFKEKLEEPKAKTTGETTGKTTGKSLALISLCMKSPQMTIPMMAKELGLTEDGVRYHLKKLQGNGLLRRIGPKKGGHWEIMRK